MWKSNFIQIQRNDFVSLKLFVRVTHKKVIVFISLHHNQRGTSASLFEIRLPGTAFFKGKKWGRKHIDNIRPPKRARGTSASLSRNITTHSMTEEEEEREFEEWLKTGPSDADRPEVEQPRPIKTPRRQKVPTHIKKQTAPSASSAAIPEKGKNSTTQA